MTPVNSGEIEQSENHENARSNAFGRFLLGINLSRGLMKSKPFQGIEKHTLFLYFIIHYPALRANKRNGFFCRHVSGMYLVRI